MTTGSLPLFQNVRGVSTPLETVVADLKAAIEVAGLWVLHEIDPQALLRRGGIENEPARQLLGIELAALCQQIMSSALKVAA